MIDILKKLKWDQPKPLNGRLLKVAPATEEFWTRYREFNHRFLFERYGISVQSRGRLYIVKWWSDTKGKFDAPRRQADSAEVSEAPKTDA